MITIRRCLAADVPEVVGFLDAHWKPGHIFTTNRSLFDWQYASPDRPGEYSMAIARQDATGALVGLLGYLPTRRFDPSLAADNTLWFALWKVRDDAAGGLGLRLLTYVTDQEPHVSAGVIGFQPPVAEIYKALKFQVGQLTHYVLPNPDVSPFQLARLTRTTFPAIIDRGLTAVRLELGSFDAQTSSLDLSERNARAPRKTPLYFRTRYLQHPIYRYLCFALHLANRPIALLATRLATHEGRHALRIVDFVGPDHAIAGLGAIVMPLVKALGAEYADVHNWGIDPALFDAGGFARVDADAGDIVPNHFEPFERRNAPIRFAFRSAQPAVLFKGDGDQDRPNRVEPSAR